MGVVERLRGEEGGGWPAAGRDRVYIYICNVCMYICSIYVCICILNIIYKNSGPFSEASPSTLPCFSRLWNLLKPWIKADSDAAVESLQRLWQMVRSCLNCGWLGSGGDIIG